MKSKPIPKFAHHLIRTTGSIRCAWAVSDPPHYLHQRQCPRRAVEYVNDIALCKQHAKMARKYYS